MSRRNKARMPSVPPGAIPAQYSAAKQQADNGHVNGADAAIIAITLEEAAMITAGRPQLFHQVSRGPTITAEDRQNGSAVPADFLG